jgi:hypothetical protein
VVALPASSATLTWYTDRAAWEAAVGNTFSLIDFSEVTAGNYSTPGVTIQDVWFQAWEAGGSAYLRVSAEGGSNHLSATGNSTYEPWNGVCSRATFNNGATYKAVGVDVDVLPASAFFYVKESADWVWLQKNNNGFVGFLSDVAVSQVFFATMTGTFGDVGAYTLDNFVFSNHGPDSQPEPTPDLDTLILCGTGLSILSFVMRLRKRAKA